MKILKLSLIILAFASVMSCSSTKQEKEYPMFWTWLNYRSGMNLDSVCAVMKETGFDGLILNASTPDDYRTAIPIAHKYGIEVYAWLWTLNLEHDRDKIVKEHPEWFSVNRNGESLSDIRAYVDYYKFMCPALPEVREFIKNKIRAYCEVEGLNGIAIDYHRLVDVILPTTLWPRYGIVQDREYSEWDYGYHPEMIRIFKEKHGYDPSEQEDPSIDELWLQFRCDQVTEVANEIAEVVHSYGKVMAASPFPTPAMSRQMVRQDWGKWNLDIVFPMVYYNFYTGDVSFIEDCTIDNVQQKNPKTTLYCGMTGINGPIMFESMDAALNNGAEGIAIFTINSLRSPKVRAQFKIYADSARAARAESKIKPTTGKILTVKSTPFKNKGIMDAVDMRMKAYLSLAKASKRNEFKDSNWEEVEKVALNALQVNTASDYLQNLNRQMLRNKQIESDLMIIENQFKDDLSQLQINLGEYQLKDEYGFTKSYEVTDAESMTTFNVMFYFYGDVFSGWSVVPEKKSYEHYRLKL